MSNYHTRCCCCCKLKKGIKIIHIFDLIFAILYIIYVIAAARSLDSQIEYLKSYYSSNWDSGSITSYDEFIKAYETTGGAFIVIPAVILDLVLLPRVLTYVLLARNFKNVRRRKLHSYVRTVTLLLLIVILIAGLITEAVLIGTGNIYIIWFASPLIVIFFLELIGVIAIDIYLTCVVFRYYKKGVIKEKEGKFNKNTNHNNHTGGV